jgi:sugar lactone lactonase YvrE
VRHLLLAASAVFAVSCSAPCPTSPPAGCATGGTGTITVTSTGLPDGVRGVITLTGPSVQTVTSSQSLSVGSGAWSATAERVTVADPRVRTVYLPTVSPATFCLADRGTQSVTVTWSRVATSNALWAINGTNDTQFVGFRSSQLGATASQPASVAARGPFGRDVAFDQDGNVWVAGPTTTDALLNRFPSSALASSGMATPDREFTVRGLSCIPAATALAFDREGNLYVASACSNEVQRIDASQLASSGEVSASLTLSVNDPGGIAFDAAGNLWVASRQDDRVWRFDASQLTGSTASAPALKLGVRASSDPMNTALAKPAWLAFDTRGDLWINDFAANTFFRVRAASLGSTGTTTAAPQVRITLGVTALLEGFAFDGQGGLWSAGVQGTLVRLAPGQLDVSSGPGAPTTPETIITSSDLGYASNLAFYPAPAGLPLFHALP